MGVDLLDQRPVVVGVHLSQCVRAVSLSLRGTLPPELVEARLKLGC